MQDTPVTGYTVPNQPPAPPGKFMAGLSLGLSGYLLAGLIFLVLALTEHASPGDRVAGALGMAWIVDLVPTLLLPVLAVRWLIRGGRRRGMGLVTGVAIGTIITVLVSVVILLKIRDWSGTCPCDPPIQLW
jgi:hypothetical protein